MRLKQMLTLVCVSVAVLLTCEAAFAQLPAAADLLPPGFKVVQTLNNPPMTGFLAKKPNEGLHQAWAHVAVELQCTLIGWVADEEATAEDIEGMKELFEETMTQYLEAPPEPDKRPEGSPMRYELCGKERYRNGVLTCRRYIERSTGGAGNEKVPDLVSYDLKWMGPSPAGQVGISLFHFAGPKETALGWIDSVIAKIAANK